MAGEVDEREGRQEEVDHYVLIHRLLEDQERENSYIRQLVFFVVDFF